MKFELKEKEFKVLCALREFGNKNILELSKRIDVPKSTVFDIIKKFEDNEIISNKTLIDFEKIGYPIKIFFLIKTNLNSKIELKRYLQNEKSVNSLYQTGSGHDFLVEGIFENFLQVHKFEEDLEEKFVILEKHAINVISQIEKEKFFESKSDLEEK